MSRTELIKPTLVMLYGFPGAGKTYFARQLATDLNAAHIQDDRIRSELFEEPTQDKNENEIVSRLMDYMTEEFLTAGVSVVYDANAARTAERRLLRELARKAKAHFLLVWLQIDTEGAFLRVVKRDHRKIDDKYSQPMDRTTFDQLVNKMQNPTQTEDYLVISGKHTYQTQRSATIKRLYDMGLIPATDAFARMVKPGLVNLVPNPLGGRVDQSRRNISVR